MTVSSRCLGRCLLNHCRQTNKLDNLSVEYVMRKDCPEQNLHTINKTDWLCTIKFNGMEFSSFGRNKKGALLETLKEVQPKILELI